MDELNTLPVLEVEPTPEPETFPMGLHEYAVTVNLDPCLAAALRVYVPAADRQRAEWDAILAEYMVRPVTS